MLRAKLANSASDSYLQVMNDLMALVKEEDFYSIIIYGAGEAGKAVRQAAEINDMKVTCFVDRKESLWGTKIESIKVLSLGQALEKSPNIPIVIGSFEFLDQIEAKLTEVLSTNSLTNRIFSVKNLIE